MTRSLALSLALVSMLATASLHAEIHLPTIIGSHMVLQQGQKNPIWGWGSPDEKVTVRIAGQNHTATVGADGTWRVMLDPLKVGGPHQMTIKGKNTIELKDILVGEVWVCSGQSNMQWPVRASNDPDLEAGSANFPNIRLITVPQTGSQSPQEVFEGRWEACSPETVPEFSAVGYFFGRLLHQTLDVPVGLIDNAWGGSSAEAWVPRPVLAADKRYEALLARWAGHEAKEENAKAMADYETALVAFRKAVADASVSGEKLPPRPPRPGRNNLSGQHRPGNLYNGVLHPIIGYGIRGAIWYQGESNAGRAYQYRHLFPLMIEQWRKAWGQGDFPFYWVQLADFQKESGQPGDSNWAELREAQTMSLRLPHTGEAVIIDIGEGRDIHPRNKQDVAKRLARWALAKDYGKEIAFRSPTYKSMETKGNKVVLTFDAVGPGLYAFDTQEVRGFAVAGSDKKFVWAKAKILGKDKVEVWSDDVAEPVSVRYAWAQNPVCNLYSRNGLPATPFRTDDWPGVTAESH